jgi:hypothetical protein
LQGQGHSITLATGISKQSLHRTKELISFTGFPKSRFPCKLDRCFPCHEESIYIYIQTRHTLYIYIWVNYICIIMYIYIICIYNMNIYIYICSRWILALSWLGRIAICIPFILYPTGMAFTQHVRSLSFEAKCPSTLIQKNTRSHVVPSFDGASPATYIN